MTQKLQIIGGKPINGEVRISGAKNSALPILAACLLSAKPISLKNVPNLHDIHSMNELLVDLGAKVDFKINDDFDHDYVIDSSNITKLTAEYEIVKKMRASVLVLGSLLGRFGEAIVSLPGGCAIGARPVDMHIDAMMALGADVEIENGYIHAKAKGGKLSGGVVNFEKISVGATENAILAAVLADGVTTINGAALEPEVQDLCNFLCSMGAKITGIGSHTLIIEGVKELVQREPYSIIPDRIEAGTYAIIAAATGGELKLTHVEPWHLTSLINVLKVAGIDVTVDGSTITVDAKGKVINAVDIVTEPYPGFPTDLQAQFMALMGICEGACNITENIFENRFMHAPELMRMGAHIVLDKNHAVITGSKSYTPAQVMATDLRASVSLLIAALNACGETVIDRIYHLDRGYEALEIKLGRCGASLSRVRS